LQSPPSTRGTTSRIGRFPYDPARLPFFYGWVILIGATLGVLMSAPGQTVGVSVFTDFLIEAHGLSRNLLSLAYLVGTIGSALLLSRVGRAYDRHGGRWLAVGAALMLALVLAGLSVSPIASTALTSLLPESYSGAAAFLVMTIGFFLLRFFGQGALTLASRNMAMEWFEKRRGLANAVLGVSVAFGFSSTPRVLEALIQHGGWQWAWRMLALVLAGFALFAFITFRARPEDHGLRPDGNLALKARKTHAETDAGRSFTLAEARRTYSFWVFALSAVLCGLLLTACTFHVVSIFGEAGISRERAVGVFIPAAFIAVSFEFVGSWLSDYIKLKYLAMVQMAGIVVLSLALATLTETRSMLLVIIGIGMMQGMFGITSSLAWPRFFGRQHLGAISGFVMSLVVAGTAIGPYLFSFIHDVFGSYAPAATACAVFSAALLLAAIRAERPQ